MAKSLGWLHLSDLHFLGASNWRDSPVLRKLQADIADCRKNGLRIDLVLCTGDIGFGKTDSEPLSSQYVAAKEFLDSVLEVCELPSNRLFLVPGNHDIDRSVVRPSTTEFFRNASRNCDDVNQMFSDRHRDVLEAMARLAQYRKFVHENYSHIPLDENAIFSVSFDINGLVVSILGLNSAWTSFDAKDKGQLWLAGRAQLLASVDKRGRSFHGVANGGVRIGLIHHPIDWLQPAEVRDIQVSLENELDFLLHGHEHDQWIRETPKPPHVVVAAGASTSGAKQELGYNIVQLGAAKSGIFLRCYTKGDGWGREIVAGRADDGYWALESPAFLTAPPDLISTPATGNSSPLSSGPGTRGHFGLDDILSRCSAQLRKNPTLAVYGLAGVGKTVLVEELRRLPEWHGLKSISLVASEGGGVGDFFGQLANYLDIRDERPSVPTGENVSEVAESLRRMTKHVPSFFLHVSRAHHWFFGGHWRYPRLALLIESLVRAFPGSVIALETREAPADPNLATVEACGLSENALKEYMAAPPGIDNASWILNRDQRHYVFSRLGGGHGRGAHAYGLFLLVQLAAGKRVSPYAILKQFPTEYAEELYEKLFREFYDKVLQPDERRLLFACSLYRNGLHYTHLPRLEAALPAVDAGQSLIRRRLLTEDAEWLYLHDLAADQAGKLAENAAGRQHVHKLIAKLWLEDLKGQKHLIEANIRRALESFYHLELAGECERVFEIAPELFGRRAEETVAALWRLEEMFRKTKQREKVRLTLEYLLRVDPIEHRAMRYLGELCLGEEGPTSQRAFDCFSKACELRPDIPDYWANLGKISAKLGAEKAQAFLVRLDEVVRAYPSAENYVVTFIRTRCLDALGHHEAASTIRMNEIRGGSRHAQNFSAEIGFRRFIKDWMGAVDLFDLARARGVYDLIMREQHADVLRDMGDDDSASAIRKELIAEGGTRSNHYVTEATFLLARDKATEAIAILELAQSRGLCDDYITAVLAKAYDQQPDGARRGSALRMKEINGGSCNAVLFADEIKWLRDNKRTNEAIELYSVANERNAVNSHVIANYTKALQIAGRGEDASRIRMDQIEQGSCEAAFFNDEAFWRIELRQFSVARDLMNLAKERGAFDGYSESVMKALGQRDD
ncbi:MAG: metallophosphoesterase [Hylemonella sp.]|nr:metallophosphoesterase [Hylemonella sp.]